MIAHRLSTIVAADKIVMLDHGRVVAQGTHEDLLKSSEAYYSLIHNQLLQYGVQSIKIRDEPSYGFVPFL